MHFYLKNQQNVATRIEKYNTKYTHDESENYKDIVEHRGKTWTKQFAKSKDVHGWDRVWLGFVTVVKSLILITLLSGKLRDDWSTLWNGKKVKVIYFTNEETPVVGRTAAAAGRHIPPATTPQQPPTPPQVTTTTTTTTTLTPTPPQVTTTTTTTITPPVPILIPLTPAIPLPEPISTPITFDELLENSTTFQKNHIEDPENFPTENQIRTIGKNDITKETLASHASNTYPMIGSPLYELADDFLKFKRENGSNIEKEVYKEMTLTQFFDRLLTNRPLAFLNKADDYLLQNGDTGSGGFEKIGSKKDKGEGELTLKKYLSYDEMQISAFLSLSTPTYFINSGGRTNSGNKDETGSFQETGVYYGCIGARYEKDGFMESQFTLIREGVDFNTDPKADMWKKFLGMAPEERFPTFEEAKAQHEKDIQENTSEINVRFINTNSAKWGTDKYFDKKLYKICMKRRLESYVRDSDKRAEGTDTKAYLHLVGLGLGVWSLPNTKNAMSKIQAECYKELIQENQLSHIGMVNFSHFSDLKDHERKAIIESFKEIGVKAEFSTREPAEKLTGDYENYLLCAQYAWDSNSFPGNEYWKKMFTATGDPAAICCSTLGDLQNPLVNPNVSGKNLHIFVPQVTAPFTPPFDGGIGDNDGTLDGNIPATERDPSLPLVTEEMVLTHQTTIEATQRALRTGLYDLLASQDPPLAENIKKTDKAFKNLPLIVTTPQGLTIRLPKELTLPNKKFDSKIEVFLQSQGIDSPKKEIQFFQQNKNFVCEWTIPFDKASSFLEQLPGVQLEKEGELTKKETLALLGIHPIHVHHSAKTDDKKPRSANTIALTLAHLNPLFHAQLVNKNKFDEPEKELETPFVTFDDLGIIIKIPESQPILKDKIESAFRLKSEGIEETFNNRQYAHLFRVNRDEIPSFLEALGMGEIPKEGLEDLYQDGTTHSYLEDLHALGRFHPYEPVLDEDPLQSLEQSLAKLVPNASREAPVVRGRQFTPQVEEGEPAKPYVALHPRGWLSIRIPEDADAYKEKLCTFLKCPSSPTQFRFGDTSYTDEIIIYEEDIPSFLKTLRLEKDVDGQPFLDKLKTSAGTDSFEVKLGINARNEIRAANTLSRTLATYDSETREKLNEFQETDFPEMALDLPLLTFNAEGMHIWIPASLQEKEFAVGPNRSLHYGQFLSHLYGATGKNGSKNEHGRNYTYQLTIPREQIESFFEKELQLRELPEGKKYGGRVTFYNELLCQFAPNLGMLKLNHASISPKGWQLRNVLPPLPDHIPTMTKEEILGAVAATLEGHPKAQTYLQRIGKTWDKAKAENNQTGELIQNYLKLLADACANNPNLSIDNKRIAWIEIGEGCGDNICMPGRFTKIQFEYNRLIHPSSGDEVKALLLDEVEQYKNGVLIEIFSNLPQNVHVHIFAAAQVQWGDAFGLNKEAGRLDTNIQYGKDQLRYYPEKKEKFQEICQSHLLPNVFEMIAQKQDEYGSLLNSALYYDRLKQILQKKGYTPTQQIGEMEQLLPTDDEGKISITQNAVKLMLIDIGVLAP